MDAQPRLSQLWGDNNGVSMRSFQSLMCMQRVRVKSMYTSMTYDEDKEDCAAAADTDTHMNAYARIRT